MFIAVVSLLFMSSHAFAAKQTTTTEPIGNDISYPQCGRSLPTNHQFGIVGVNGGKATTTNPCLVTQLQWANKAKGTTSQPKVQLYVNTANPGEVIDQVTTWPTSSTTENPYPDPCTGANDLACSWQYGYNRAVDDVELRFKPAVQSAGLSTDPSSYIWWLDVETMNTWQSGSPEALARNAASLEGMTAYFQSLKAEVGLYSTSYQWGIISGDNIGITGNLAGLKSWLAGASGLSSAKTFCGKPALTLGGKVVLTQYISGRFDYDYSCFK